MFYAVLEFVMQLSLIYLLVAMFILIDLLLSAVRARRFREEKERREAYHLRNEERRQRRKNTDRQSIPTRVPRPAGGLAGIPIRRKAGR